MFQKVSDPDLLSGEHSVLRFWTERKVFSKLREKVRGAVDENGNPKRFSFLDGPMTANNPMGVHHAWGRTYKDAFQRYFAMTGHDQRWQNGFDCQGLWVEVEVEKQLNLGSKTAIAEYGIDKFVWECKRRVLNFAARQTEQSVRLGYWMDWDDPDGLRRLAENMGSADPVEYTTPSGKTVTDTAENIASRLGHDGFGGSYFTFSTDNNETIWTFLKKCHERGKIYRGHDVMPWSGRGGSAYSQMEVADGRRLHTHRALFVRFPLKESVLAHASMDDGSKDDGESDASSLIHNPSSSAPAESLLVWTTTPWTLTSNVAAAVNPELEYVCIALNKDTSFGKAGDRLWFAKDNLHSKRGEKEYKEGFGADGSWPEDVPKLKSLHQIFKEQGGYEEVETAVGARLLDRMYAGPFDEVVAQNMTGGYTPDDLPVTDREVVQIAELVREYFAGVDNFSAPIESLARSVAVEAFALEVLGREEVRRRRIGTDRLYINLIKHADRYELPGKRSRFGFDEWNYELLEVGHEELKQKYVRAAERNFEALLSAIERASLETRPDLSMKLVERGAASKRPEREEPIQNVRTAVMRHRVIDGGRDSRGNPLVVAGEGTGIVHSAPGCGDVDHQWGVKYGLPVIAPLKEDGTFGEGFGPFTGMKATDQETVDLVVSSLKEKGLLVYEEKYPHIYPFCWRTGDELVFRLVDEWFINMDWREEIKEVVDTIEWLPPAINGREREKEWLTIMRDWMISKKRFWGLALPIWRDDETGEFFVFGSVAELKAHYDEHGGEGWEQFEGHTPHKPWIDFVKLKHPTSGNMMSRVEDVGNPWLDAGITPFSTMGYNENREEWEKWFPADLVLECFPGQFRNWFYSLLSLSTMMRHDEETPEAKRPFKTLFGHRLVMNEHGQEMHKSDGTAIWFEEAAEQLGVDTLRWMYLAQNPAADLKLGLRDEDTPVTLRTPDGPITETKEGLPTCKVTSTPADEVRRQVLIPLWNSYAFFVNYARLDGFDPSWEKVPVSERPEIDRWVLSNLQALITECRAGFEAFDTQRVTAAAAEFVGDLSGWYIRRNRRRFWAKVVVQASSLPSESGSARTQAGSMHHNFGTDKLAAYQTLYETLVTLTKLLAPCVPFLSERMYGNLVGSPLSDTASDSTASPSREGGGQGTSPDGSMLAGEKASNAPRPDGTGLTGRPVIAGDVPESVHLCDYPDADAALLDAELNASMAAAQRAVALGHRMREDAGHRVRQPLAEMRFASTNAAERAALEKLADVVAEELNVKAVVPAENLDDLVSYAFKPNLKTLGPKCGKRLGVIRKELPEVDAATLAPLRAGEPVTVELSDGPLELQPEDVLVSTEQASDWASGSDGTLQVALSTQLTPELEREGFARDVIRLIQQARKDAGLEIEDRIVVTLSGLEGEVAKAVEEHGPAIRSETLADAIERGDAPKAGKVGGQEVGVAVSRAS